MFFCRGLGFIIWFLVSRFCLWVWYLVWSLSPSSPDPCLVFVGVPLFFFCLVGFVDAVFSLLFSFSQALGKPKRGSPCVSPLRPSTTTSIRSSSFSPSPRFPPRLVFYFSRRRSRGCFSGVFLIALSVCLVVCVGFFGLFLCIACKMYNAQSFWREGDNHLPPPFHCHGDCFWGLGSHPLPAECCKRQPRKGVGDRIGQQPYCPSHTHTHC